MPRAPGKTSRASRWIMKVLNATPHRVRTGDLVSLCGFSLRQPRTGIWKLLLSLEKVHKIVRIVDGRKLRWTSAKWIANSGGASNSAGDTGAPKGDDSVPLRQTLPSRRRCVSQTVRIITCEGKKQTVHYTIGLYEDGTPGELFIDVARAGAALRAWAGEMAMMLSIGLQHHTPLETILNLFIGTRNDPHGQVEGHNRIQSCTSIMDLIARDMAITFLQREDLADTDAWSVVPVPISDGSSLPEPVEGQTCVCHTHKPDPGT